MPAPGVEPSAWRLSKIAFPSQPKPSFSRRGLQRRDRMSGNPAVDLNVALIAVSGVVYTGAVALIVHYFTNRARDQELFQSALGFITGQTQNRSVGISLLRSYAREHKEKEG